jgi:hypothetical protein
MPVEIIQQRLLTVRVVRFLGLVVVLNIVRYAGGALFEPVLIFPGLMNAMEASAGYFRLDFQASDWITSYFYNFIMWLCCVWIFHLARPAVAGSDLVASFTVFGIMWLSFASISAIYMNHYSHPKNFYFWNVADSLLVFALVALANGFLYRKIMGPAAVHCPGGAAGTHR